MAQRKRSAMIPNINEPMPTEESIDEIITENVVMGEKIEVTPTVESPVIIPITPPQSEIATLSNINNVAISVNIWKGSIRAFSGFRLISEIVKLMDKRDSDIRIVVDSITIATELKRLLPNSADKISSK